jgi:hypothetical protein
VVKGALDAQEVAERRAHEAESLVETLRADIVTTRYRCTALERERDEATKERDFFDSERMREVDEGDRLAAALRTVRFELASAKPHLSPGFAHACVLHAIEACDAATPESEETP